MTFVDVEYTDVICCGCGLIFRMPKAWDIDRRNKHSSFFCPNGHSLSYGAKSPEEKLRDEVETLKKSRDYWQKEHDCAQVRIHEEQKKREKLERRVKSGVCPCCKRSFTNLRRHISSKHPKFSHDEEKP